VAEAEPNLNNGFTARKRQAAQSRAMDRFAVKSPTLGVPQTAARSSKLLSLLMILEALRQEPVPMRPQKV